MVHKIAFYLQLAWLCLRLGLKTSVFVLRVLINKISQQRILVIGGSLALLLIWLANFYIFKQKNIPQVTISQTANIAGITQIESGSQQILRDRNQLQQDLYTYQEKEQMKIKSLGLLLNLSQIHQSLGDEESAQKYLKQAQLIAPNAHYQNN